MLFEFSFWQVCATALIFVWTGFVRSGLGFGGAALGLPLMLFVYNQPLFWLPLIGLHLLFFSSLTLRSRLNQVDWGYLLRASVFIVPPALVGVFGLIRLPNDWLLIFIYGVTLVYALMWAIGFVIHSQSRVVDKLLLVVGGYVAGTSLTGAPLMVAVFAQRVDKALLRNTLFVLWFSLVFLKLSTFVALGVALQWQSSLALIPAAFIGHLLGLRVHEIILQNDERFRRVIGVVLIVISSLGLFSVFSAW